MSKPRIVIASADGTIVSSGSSATQLTGYSLQGLTAGDLVAAVPSLSEIADIEVLPVCNIGSSNMNEALWVKLAARNEPVKFTATLGRDHQCSLSTTASGRNPVESCTLAVAKERLEISGRNLATRRKELHESPVDSAKPSKFMSAAFFPPAPKRPKQQDASPNSSVHFLLAPMLATRRQAQLEPQTSGPIGRNSSPLPNLSGYVMPYCCISAPTSIQIILSFSKKFKSDVK